MTRILEFFEMVKVAFVSRLDYFLALENLFAKVSAFLILDGYLTSDVTLKAKENCHNSLGPYCTQPSTVRVGLMPLCVLHRDLEE